MMRQSEFVVYGATTVHTSGIPNEALMIPPTCDDEKLELQARAILQGEYGATNIGVSGNLAAYLGRASSHLQAAEMLEKIASGQVTPSAGQVDNLKRIIEATQTLAPSTPPRRCIIIG